MSNNRQHQQQSPSSNPNASPQNRMPTALQYMSLQQKASSLISQSLTATAVSQAATASTSTSSGSNSNETHIRPASPLDLSASMPITKRLKMESPSPVRSLGSPPATQLQPSSQSIPRNRAQTPSVAGMTTSTNAVASVAGAAANASSQRRCHAQSDEINSWTVAQVCEFVSSIDICAEYVEVSENALRSAHFLFRTSHAIYFHILFDDQQQNVSILWHLCAEEILTTLVSRTPPPPLRRN